MKLLYLHHIAIDSQKANIVQVLQMCHAFQQAGVDVTLAVPMRESGVGNMDVLRGELGVDVKFKIKEYRKYGWRGRPMLLGTYWGIKRILENSRKYDYCYVRSSFLAGLSVKRGLKTIYEEHEQRLHRRSVMNRWYMKKLFKIIDSDNLARMVVISQALADVWLGYGAASEKIQVLHDGFPATDYKVIISREKARGLLGIKSERKIVVYAGSLYKDRGIEHLLLLAKTFPDVDFYVVGGPKKNKLFYEQESVRQGLSNVTFVGTVPHHKVRNYLFAADVLLMLYTDKVATIDICSPLKAFEYMAAGRIIVGQAFPTIKEVLSDGRNALLAEVNSYSELENKMHLALAMEYPNKMAENARHLAFEKYSWRMRVQAILKKLNIDQVL